MNNSIRKKLGVKIKQLRKLRKLTQEQLGEQAGISYKFIGEVERGAVNPSLDSLTCIARAEGILFLVEIGKSGSPVA